jgi:hypothetical protein
MREVIGQLAAEGWSVTREPRETQLPVVLQERGIRADFVAVRGTEILVGEVASRRTVTERRLGALAQLIGGIPDARLEVYWLGEDEPEGPGDTAVRAYSAEAVAALDVSPRASLLIALAAFEGALMSYAESQGLPVKQTLLTPMRLVENLFALGLLDPSDRTLLRGIYNLRNQIAHRASPSKPPSRDQVQALLGLAERMASGRYVSIDQMTEWLSEWLKDHPRNAPANDDEARQSAMATMLVLLLASQFPSASLEARRAAVGNLTELEEGHPPKSDPAD